MFERSKYGTGWKIPIQKNDDKLIFKKSWTKNTKSQFSLKLPKMDKT